MADVRPKFSRQHYNAIAKDIREELDSALKFYSGGMERVPDKKHTYYAVDALVKIALRFAKRFAADNPRFNPVGFLNACSPNQDLYPLGELWQDE